MSTVNDCKLASQLSTIRVAADMSFSEIILLKFLYDNLTKYKFQQFIYSW